MIKTKAAILYEINKPLQIKELIIPKLKPGQVLVKIYYSGVCHSQLNEIKGLKGEDKFLPHTLGHEGSGIVCQVGEGVVKVKPGDHVVLTWIKGSGANVSSSLYRRNNGSIVNSGAISTFLTKAVVSENRLVKIPQEMPLREATLLGCAIPTGAGIIMNIVKVSSSDTSIAIFGMGGIGLSALLTAKMVGIPMIIAIDVSDQKLEQTIKFGATHTINARREDVLSNILKITNGYGVDYAIECAGKKESMENAFQAVRDDKGLCIIAGNLPHGDKISINPFDLIKGKRIIGTWGGETQPDRDIPMYVDLYLSGKLKLNELITRRYSLQNINKAFEDLLAGKEIRIVIDMTTKANLDNAKIID